MRMLLGPLEFINLGVLWLPTPLGPLRVSECGLLLVAVVNTWQSPDTHIIKFDLLNSPLKQAGRDS